MENNQQFPSKYHTASASEKLAYYDSYTMAHPYMDMAFETLKPIIMIAEIHGLFLLLVQRG